MADHGHPWGGAPLGVEGVGQPDHDELAAVDRLVLDAVLPELGEELAVRRGLLTLGARLQAEPAPPAARRRMRLLVDGGFRRAALGSTLAAALRLAPPTRVPSRVGEVGERE